ncbi:MAG: hypothetical protein RMY64_07410 [Nostoc sp. DedQUE08]|uniref:hypothetical protein n=1 Tax=unclassified Nostoc TaxID=2593658 RepID=UPI002AD4754F|nr:MULTISPECIES: hypothetical protein [unclassified Nostoc]MDZ8065455.1 hypothetical protein [Nostoc sp. DedQUE08]MDZ8094241.1 hypothetical protein [Nostoc sp. DedQUE05]
MKTVIISGDITIYIKGHQRRSLSTVLDICNKYSNLISEESIAYLRDVLRSLLITKLIPYSARQERRNA